MDERITVTAQEGFVIAMRAVLDKIDELQKAQFVEVYDMEEAEKEFEVLKSDVEPRLWYDMPRASLYRFQCPQLSFGFRLRRHTIGGITQARDQRDDVASNPDIDGPYRWYSRASAYPNGGEMVERELEVYLQMLLIAQSAVKAFNETMMTFYVSAAETP